MTAGRWQKIERIFESVLAVPPDQRNAYLHEACGGDRELCEEVAAMLRGHDETASLFGQPVADLAAELTEPRPGDRIDRYIITRALGAGGMGRIYEARDSRLDRLVALKMLPPGAFLKPGVAGRFGREARAASSLNHPNVVTVLDFHTLPRPYLVTELVEGDSLRSRLPLTPPEADGVLRQLASALAAVHRAGMVHRDIKPENIMVRPDGLVKLIDFGLARLPQADTSFQTESGVVMGTYAYMAPEQMSGGESDCRSDIWSFGIVADELTHGGAWKTVIDRCLRKNPEERFQDGTELLAAVNRRFHPARRRVLVAGGSAAAAGALAGAAWWRARSAAQLSVRGMTPLTDFGDVLRAAVSRDGRFLAMVCGLEGAQRLIVRHLPSGADVTLMPSSAVRFRGVALSPDGNFVFASYASGQTVATLWRFPAVGGDPVKIADDVDSAVTFDPSGGRMAFVRRTRTASHLILRSREREYVVAQQPPEDAFSFAGPAWSPDGALIAAAAGVRNMRLLLVDPARGTVRRLPGKPAWYIGRLAWWDADHLIASLSNSPGIPPQLHLIHARSGAATALTNDVSAYREPAVSASGVISALREEFFSYLSVTPGPKRVSFGREQFSYVRWAAPGRLVLTATTANRYDLWTFEVTTGHRMRLTETSSSERHPCWSPVARRFAVFSDRDGEWNLWTFDVNGGDWRQLTTGKTGGMYPEWTPDGRRLVFEATRDGDGIFGVWVIDADGKGLRRLRPGITRFPAVSPDGRLIACQFERDKHWAIGTFRLSTGDLVDVVAEHAISTPPRWQPDGRSLLWIQNNGHASDLLASNPAPRVLRRLEEQGSVDSFDIDRAGSIAYLTGIKEGDVVRLET